MSEPDASTKAGNHRGAPSDPSGGGSADEPNQIGRIELLITALVQMAPASDPAITGELVERLQRISPPDAAPLARSIAQVVERVAARQIDPGIALPPLAMACATLTDGLAGRLTARELEAARYEIDTLLPVPGQAPAMAAPDVPLSALRRRPP